MVERHVYTVEVARSSRAPPILAGRLLDPRLDGDDDLSSGVSFSEIPKSLGSLAQPIGPIDDRPDLSGLDELLQDNQILPGMPREEDAHLMVHER